MSEKVISINLKTLKEKTQEAGKKVATSTLEKVENLSQKVKATAKERKDKVVGSLLDKGIELTEKQMSSLKKLKSKK